MQQIRSIDIQGAPVGPCDSWWPIMAKGKKVGRISSAAYSPDHKTNVAIGMVRMTHWDPETEITVETPDGPRSAIVRDKFWI